MHSALSTGVSPASLLIQKRCFKTRLPDLKFCPTDDSVVRAKDKQKKMLAKKYADAKRSVKPCILSVHDKVLVKRRRVCKGTPHYDPEPFTIVNRKGNMIVARRGDKEVVCNSSYFKKWTDPDSFSVSTPPEGPESGPSEESSSESTDTFAATDTAQPPLRRSKRQRLLLPALSDYKLNKIMLHEFPT